MRRACRIAWHDGGMLKLTVAAVVVAALLPAATARADGFETSAPPLDKVLEQARAVNKPVLLDFSAVW